MALLPAPRTGALSRPGSQVPARWDPFAESGDLYQRMGQLTGGTAEGGWQPAAQSWAPLADLSETDQAWLAEVELAAPDLIISGEFADAARQGRALRRGRRSGRSGYRVLPGQADPDKITAALADGLLTVTVPKAEADKPRRIQVTG